MLLSGTINIIGSTGKNVAIKIILQIIVLCLNGLGCPKNKIRFAQSGKCILAVSVFLSLAAAKLPTQ